MEPSQYGNGQAIALPTQDQAGLSYQKSAQVALAPTTQESKPSPVTQQAGSSNQLSETPSVAQDSELIDNAWVAAVRQIIKHNSNDPYSLNRAIIRARADYMKKRYNKDIKITD